MLKEVKIVTYVTVTFDIHDCSPKEKIKEHKLSTYVCEIKVQC
jgi:hypothetical protein